MDGRNSHGGGGAQARHHSGPVAAQRRPAACAGHGAAEELLGDIDRKYVGSIKGTNVPNQVKTLPPSVTKQLSHVAQRCAVGTSILRVERAVAKEWQGEGQRRVAEFTNKKIAGQALGDGEQHQAKQKDLATARVAAAVYVHRTTFERVQKVRCVLASTRKSFS